MDVLIYEKATGYHCSIRVANELRQQEVLAMGFRGGVFVAAGGGYPDNGVFAEIEIDLTAPDIENIEKGLRRIVDGKLIVADNARQKENYEAKLAIKAESK